MGFFRSRKSGGQTGGGDLGEPWNALGEVQARGCWRLAELLIAVPKRSWREIFPWKSNSGVRNQKSPPRAAKGVEKDARWKSPKAGLSHRAWKSSKRRWIPTFPTPSTAAGMWGILFVVDGKNS
jgi:hypothetical protein